MIDDVMQNERWGAIRDAVERDRDFGVAPWPIIRVLRAQPTPVPPARRLGLMIAKEHTQTTDEGLRHVARRIGVWGIEPTDVEADHALEVGIRREIWKVGHLQSKVRQDKPP